MTKAQAAEIENKVIECGGVRIDGDTYQIGLEFGTLQYWGERFGMLDKKIRRPKTRRTQAAWGEYAYFVAVAKAAR